MAKTPNAAPAAEGDFPVSIPVTEEQKALALKAELDAELAADAGLGGENVTEEDRIIPWLRIVQSMSKVRKKTEASFIEGAQEGMVYHTVTTQLWDGEKEGVLVLPIIYMRRYTEWYPIGSKEGEGLVKDWGQDDSRLADCHQEDGGADMTPEGTELVTSADFFVFVVDPQTGSFDPVVISMASTQRKKARAWLTRLTTMRVNIGGRSIVPAFFYGLWRLKTVPESKGTNNWHGWKIDFEGPVLNLPNGVDIYRAAKEFREQVLKGAVKSATDDPAERKAASSSGGGAPAADEEIPF